MFDDSVTLQLGYLSVRLKKLLSIFGKKMMYNGMKISKEKRMDFDDS